MKMKKDDFDAKLNEYMATKFIPAISSLSAKFVLGAMAGAKAFRLDLAGEGALGMLGVLGPDGMVDVDALKRAWLACEARGAMYELEVRHALSVVLALLAEHLPEEHPARTRRIARDNERIRIMLEYIQQNFAGELTVESIARSAMVSQSECLRCFRNTIGLTPIQYARSYRIQRASEQLRLWALAQIEAGGWIFD